MLLNAAFSQLVLNQMRERNLIRKSRTGIEYLTGKINLNRGLARCDTENKVLWYCYDYMYAHFDAYLYVLKAEAPVVHDEILKVNKAPVFVDFGCGPMTSGLALADFYGDTAFGKKLNLSYIGIDYCEPMLKKAKEFSEYEGLFGSDSSFLFVNSWRDLDFELLRSYLSGDGHMVLNFSYFFGQALKDDLLADISDFVKRIKAEFKRNKVWIVYLNASYPGANQRYRLFKKSLGLRTSIRNFARVPTRFMQNRNVGQLEYRVSAKDNISYEVFHL